MDLASASEVLEIDARAVISASGLSLPENLSVAEWIGIGRKLVLADKAVQWALGDWWVYGEHHYGDRAAIAIQIGERDFQTLMNYGSVSRSIEASRRREVLPWSAHAEVAALEADVQDKILASAADLDWSVRDVRQAVKEYRGAIGAPAKPRDISSQASDDPADETPAIEIVNPNPSAEGRRAFIDMLDLADHALSSDGLEKLIRQGRLDHARIRSLARRLEWLASEIEAHAKGQAA